jgi:succinate dehydrogenase / fumarate reductase cytochrome b subunit
VFHLANGIWTFGITWGIWVTPQSQRWADRVCLVFGLLLAAVSMGALGGFSLQFRSEEELKKVRKIEDSMYEERVKIGQIDANEHKRKRDDERKDEKPAETAAVDHNSPSPQP